LKPYPLRGLQNEEKRSSEIQLKLTGWKPVALTLRIGKKKPCNLRRLAQSPKDWKLLVVGMKRKIPTLINI